MNTQVFKIKDWIKYKGAQFKILQKFPGYPFSSEDSIYSVLRLNDNLVFTTGILPHPGYIGTITRFDQDLVHVYLAQWDHDQPGSPQVADRKIPINDLEKIY